MSTHPIAIVALLAAGCIAPPGGGGGAAATTTPTVDPDTGVTDTGGDGIVDTFEQVMNPLADILWVIDNSCSMAGEHRDIRQSFPVFIDFFLGAAVDYHIGVVSTDMVQAGHAGELLEHGGVKWIDAATPDPVGFFAGLPIDTLGSKSEEGIRAAHEAMTVQAAANAGFFRAGAALRIIVVSDESDFSPPTAEDDLVATLDALPVDPADVTFDSLVAPAANLCAEVSTAGTRYIDLTARVGGIHDSLCSGASPVERMERLGVQAAGLRHAWTLSVLPDPGTIEVTVEVNGLSSLFTEYDPVTGIGDWTWDAPTNTVAFSEYVPPPGSFVSIRYTPAP